MKGRLNLFQATMLRWRALHPYNAVHVVRIDRPLDRARLSSAIDETLEARGLTVVELDPGRARYTYTEEALHPSVDVRAAPADATRVLLGEIETELNGSFPQSGRGCPFRFFAVDAGGWFHLGLTYDHYIAGGDSIVVLLAGIVARYRGETIGHDASARLERYPPTCRKLFTEQPLPTLRGLRRLREMRASCKRSVRPRYPRGSDPHNAYAYRRLDAPKLDRLVRATKSWGVTVNDLLIAILLRALEPLAGERSPRERRHELAVASIMSLRNDFHNDPNTTFGQFLSAFRVSHPVPDGVSLEQLARDVHAETARVKNEKLYLQNLLALGATAAVWSLLSPERRQGFYTKHYPVWAEITLINVDALWAHAGARLPPPAYLRAVSTGPLAPLLFAMTTADNVLHAGISYRTAAFTPATIDTMADAIAACFEHLDS